MQQQQLETVLRVRRHQRDQVRMALARLLADARVAEERRQQVVQERSGTLAALRDSTTSGFVDVDQAAALRYHAARLSIDIAKATAENNTHNEHVRAAQAMLAKADQAVKAVEKLKERHEAERLRIVVRQEDREATDRFSATTMGSNGVD